MRLDCLRCGTFPTSVWGVGSQGRPPSRDSCHRRARRPDRRTFPPRRHSGAPTRSSESRSGSRRSPQSQGVTFRARQAFVVRSLAQSLDVDVMWRSAGPSRFHPAQHKHTPRMCSWARTRWGVGASCVAWMDVNPVARGVLDAAADSSVPLEVRALENDCWRCGRASQVPIVVHPVGHTDAADLVWAMGDDTGIWYLKSLLTAARHPAAPAPRKSSTPEPQAAPTCRMVVRNATHSSEHFGWRRLRPTSCTAAWSTCPCSRASIVRWSNGGP